MLKVRYLYPQIATWLPSNIFIIYIEQLSIFAQKQLLRYLSIQRTSDH